jgi:predicted unusual protein kinase regulating ubiquinone biosynthesis (AarF/ABC1/UbiB family)
MGLMTEIRRGRVARTAPLVGLAGRTAGEAVVTALRRRPRDEEFHTRAAERYARSLGRSRGVLMKAGQILSFVSLGTMVPPEHQAIYHRALSRLQDDAPPMPPELAAAVVAEEFGAPPTEVFAHFAPEPLAAASIGQVHAATLHDGRRVAVKVQYPGVEEAIRADLANTELLTTFLRIIRGMMPPMAGMDSRGMARELGDRIGEEVDYLAEAKNQRDFADLYRGHPFIRIPEVVPELTTRRVLTQQLVEGQRWRDAVVAPAELRLRWGEAISRFTLGTLRRTGWFNADPHPGNYLFHHDGTVTFLDFGCVRRFTPEHVAWVKGVVGRTVDGDAEGLLRVFVAEGCVDETDPPSAERLLAWSKTGLAPLVEAQPYTYTPEYATRVIMEHFAPHGPYQDVLSKITLPPNYLFLTRIDLGLTAVLAGLRASAPWEPIRREWDCGEPPATPMGVLEAAFWSES